MFCINNCIFFLLQLVYMYVYAHTKIKTLFKLCTGTVPMQVLQPDKKSLIQYGLTTSSLLLLEETPSDDDDKWIDSLVCTKLYNCNLFFVRCNAKKLKERYHIFLV